MKLPSTVPAVEYRNLVMQLGHRRELEPENDEVHQLMNEVLALGDAAGAVTRTAPEATAPIPGTDDVWLVAAFPWSTETLVVNEAEARLLARVAEVTHIPE